MNAHQNLSASPAGMTKTIPFDYAFEFQLSGQRGSKVQDVVQISVEGVFVATAVGYSLMLDEARTPRFVQPEFDRPTLFLDPVGFPFFRGEGPPSGLVVTGKPGSQAAILEVSEVPLSSPPDDAPPIGATRSGGSPRILAEGMIGADGIALLDFKDPLELNTVVQVWDRTSNQLGQPIEVGELSTPIIGPDPVSKALPLPQEGDAGASRVSVYGSGGDSFELFLIDGAGQVHPLLGGTMMEDTATFGQLVLRSTMDLQLRHSGENVRLAAGDLLLVRGTKSDFLIPSSNYAVPRPRPTTITLGAISRGLERIGTDLTAGFRLNPPFADRFNADIPLDKINPDIRPQLFQTGCSAAQEVSFLYCIDVLGSGRELQNKAIHNIAGLGIANGDRPFRPLAKPFAIAPRSSVRIQVEELSGPAGKLYIVLHGYKMLGKTSIYA